MTSLAKRLVHARKLKGKLWSQKHLAKSAAVSLASIGMMEAGKRGDTGGRIPGSLNQIAEALGVNFQWLAHGTGPMMIVGDQGKSSAVVVNADQAELSPLQIATLDGLTRALRNGAFTDKDCLDLLQRLIN